MTKMNFLNSCFEYCYQCYDTIGWTLTVHTSV